MYTEKKRSQANYIFEIIQVIDFVSPNCGQEVKVVQNFHLAAGQVDESITAPISGTAVPAVALPQGAQMTRQARRLYIGNMPFGTVTEVRFTLHLFSPPCSLR